MSGPPGTATYAIFSIPFTVVPMRMMDGLLMLDRAKGDLEGQLYRALRDAILDGRLTGGTEIPATRPLADAVC